MSTTLVNWCLSLICSITFFLYVKVWAVSRPNSEDILSLHIMTGVLALSARVLCYPAERALALYLCILPARLLLVVKGGGMWVKAGTSSIDIDEAIVAAVGSDTEPIVKKRKEACAPLTFQVNLGIGLLVKETASRLMRTYYSAHFQAFAPARMKMLARDPMLSCLDCIDALLAAYLRYRHERLSDDFENMCGLGVGLDEGVAVAMPIVSMAMLMLRYSEWFERGGGRHVGDLPFWLTALSIILVDTRDLAVVFRLLTDMYQRRGSDGHISLSDFLATSRIPDNLRCNPVLISGRCLG
jgi:hypothetical protein